MYVVLGATGNVGSEIVKKLLAKGEKVRAVARDPRKLNLLADGGAEAFPADVNDDAALVRAMMGARAAFVLIPPSITSTDYAEDQERIGSSIAAALEESKVQYAVSLSSVGAHAPSGTGPIAGLHRFEEKLNAIAALNVLHVRAAYFMENTLEGINMIKSIGMIAGAMRPDLMIPMIASRDIGDYAAERLLQLDFAGKQTRELLGERDLSMNGVTAIIGRAIEKPELRYMQMPYEQLEQALIQMGVPPKTASFYVELYQGVNDGIVVNLEPRSENNTTATTFEQFVSEVFVPAFRAKAAAA
ncbi:MAG: NmrA family NAD(P)-binding protein [Acidobacteriota bacterium]|nr:NmrA family NAD(P)-binding protein [Acidobacteriota bacterium]